MKKKVKGRGQGQERTGSPLKKVKGAIERVSPEAKPSLRSKSRKIAERSAGLREQRIDWSVKKVKGRGEGEQRIGPLVKNVKGGRMIPLGGGSLHERAEACRAWARAECEKRNAAAEKAALARFEKGPVAKLFREECAYIIGLLAQRLERVRCGETTVPLEPFDAETAVRLLSTITATDYAHWTWDEKLPDCEITKSRSKGVLVGSDCRTMLVTQAMSNQVVLRKVFADYARVAAAYAKHIGSESVLQWAEILDLLEQGPRGFTRYFPKETARRMVDLERMAADRLRIDKIVAELPSFQRARGAGR